MTDATRKYAIIVNGDNLDEAVEETAHLLYFVLGRALRAHRRDHAEECGFEKGKISAHPLRYRGAR